MYSAIPFNTLVGKTIESFEIGLTKDIIDIRTTDGKAYRMLHYDDCCEVVDVEDIAGDTADIIGYPVLQAEESTSNENPADVKKEYQDDSFTWTFYRLATIKGQIVIRWYGESNGYYSESVDFIEIAA